MKQNKIMKIIGITSLVIIIAMAIVWLKPYFDFQYSERLLIVFPFINFYLVTRLIKAKRGLKHWQDKEYHLKAIISRKDQIIIELKEKICL